LLELTIIKVRTIATPFSIFQLPFLTAFFKFHQLTYLLYFEPQVILLLQQTSLKQFTFKSPQVELRSQPIEFKVSQPLPWLPQLLARVELSGHHTILLGYHTHFLQLGQKWRLNESHQQVYYRT
jgi:hypothetical protein